ncbi:uncharacterized protein MICPUCDRAFT_34555 [Micromonas pusilla CCMP1545]|uniref:Predicted protein n=1 Tax=Micromonas pusilla (strain CCMP1545) TaxID=564608 RepID=C1MX54_MICPC|nr:uncharacterized protein MICPUCDRAFT_34555 [Micromonas pusilla CCMP1545]EEH55402.1 predicted protein [Micromonas pusilla CCMP1545]|eukprot:XP_003060633.1 predicted protein [Micromonas pusilla CCMP1545]
MANGDAAFAASTAPLTFQSFLEKMRHPSASELVKSIKGFIASFDDAAVARDSDADGARVQEFLRETERAFRGHPAWRGASQEELDASGEGLEKYLMTKLYPKTFAVAPDDVAADDFLGARVAALASFVRPEHLDIPTRFHSDASWSLARNELCKMNNFKAPRDKLVCVLNTCRIVNNLLNATHGPTSPPGADDFLPALIYVVLRSNPAALESNARFISRFRLESRLASEAAYFFTNLQSATRFLSSCDASAFTGLEKEAFDARDDAKRQQELWSAMQKDRQRLERELAEARRDAAAASAAARENAKTSSAPRPPAVPTPTRPTRRPLRWKTVEDVEAEGAAAVASSDAAGTLRLPYKFLYARADDLQVGDVPGLLHAYKSLALQYEALSRGVGAVLSAASGDEGAHVLGGEEVTVVPETPAPIAPATATAAAAATGGDDAGGGDGDLRDIFASLASIGPSEGGASGGAREPSSGEDPFGRLDADVAALSAADPFANLPSQAK